MISVSDLQYFSRIRIWPKSQSIVQRDINNYSLLESPKPLDLVGINSNVHAALGSYFR